MYSVKYLEDVLWDIREAKDYYKNKQIGLEERFAKNIEDAINKIIKIPTAYNIRYKNVRIAHPKTFPYNIHFYIDESIKTIVITGIVYNKRNNALFLNR
jgi:hypothetical protein